MRLMRLPILDELILAKLLASLLALLDCTPVKLLYSDSLTGGVCSEGDSGGATSAIETEHESVSSGNENILDAKGFRK